MGDRRTAVFTGPCILLIIVPACASRKQPLPPPADPVKTQITILQKQFLDLQAVQNETRRRIDEQASVTSTLDTRLKAIETERSSSPAAPSPDILPPSKQTTVQKASLKPPGKKQSPAKKKPAKKNKHNSVRRVEQ